MTGGRRREGVAEMSGGIKRDMARSDGAWDIGGGDTGGRVVITTPGGPGSVLVLVSSSYTCRSL